MTAWPPTFDARVVGARMLAPSVREVSFERVDGQPMTFAAGQFCNMLLPIPHELDGSHIKRSYSIASPPSATPRFDLAVTLVRGGRASAWIHALAPGAVVPFTGPHGFFTRPVAAAAPSLMIATGTGVTPIRSMVLDAVAAGSRAPMWIVLGVRHEEDLLYERELRDLAERHPFIRFEPTLSQPQSAWPGRRGYVQTHVRALWEELAAHAGPPPHAYVCGLERMVSSVRDILRTQMSIPRAQVHSERYD
jgi:ferredoxin-NADP reductase